MGCPAPGPGPGRCRPLASAAPLGRAVAACRPRAMGASGPAGSARPGWGAGWRSGSTGSSMTTATTTGGNPGRLRHHPVVGAVRRGGRRSASSAGRTAVSIPSRLGPVRPGGSLRRRPGRLTCPRRRRALGLRLRAAAAALRPFPAARFALIRAPSPRHPFLRSHHRRQPRRPPPKAMAGGRPGPTMPASASTAGSVRCAAALRIRCRRRRRPAGPPASTARAQAVGPCPAPPAAAEAPPNHRFGSWQSA